MRVTPFTITLSRAVAAAAILTVVLPHSVKGQVAQRFTIGGRDIVNMTFAGTQVGELPTGLKLLSGTVDVVDVGGVHMLRASSESELELPLPQILPQDFSVEFEFIPKQCCNPQDLAIEGTSVGHSNPGSSQITWHRNRVTVIGGGESFAADMPEVLANSTPGTPTVVQVVMQGTTLKLYTNGRRLYTLSDRKFVRAQKLWIYLGGQDDGKYAVYVSRIRVIDNAPPVGPIVASNPAPPAIGGSAAPPPSSPSPSSGGGSSSAASGSGRGVGTGSPGTSSGISGGTTSYGTGGAPSSTGTGSGSGQPSAGTSSSTGGGNASPGTGGAAPSSSTTGTVSGTSSSGGSAPGSGGGPVPSAKTGPATTQVQNFGSFLVVSWSPVPNAVSYNVYRKESATTSPGQIATYFFPSNLAVNPGDVGGVDPYLVPKTDLTYWVEAVFAGGSSGVPGPVATTFVNAIGVTTWGPTNLSVSIAGSQAQPALQGQVGSTVTWTWDVGQLGYGIALDIYLPKATSVQVVREFLPLPNVVTSLPPNGSPGKATYSTFIPQGSTVYFCATVFPSDDPRTLGGGPMNAPNTVGPSSFAGASCYLSRVP